MFGLPGINSIPGNYLQNARKKWWIYTIAYHFKLDPSEVETWDNDSILETLASLKMLGVVK